jgi:single-strand DNA-binding protein
MADINHVVLVGRLTRDAELKYTNSGQAVTNISVAINQRRKRDDQWVEEGHFFDCVVWGKTAESLSSYLVKGKQVGIEGHLRQNRWEQEGRTRSKVEIFTTNIQLLGSRSDSSTGAAPRTDRDDQVPAAPPSDGIPANDEFADDIPF